MSETFRRKFLSCRGCFLGCEACQRHSAGSFCHVAVASLGARHVRNIPPEVSVVSWLLPWMRGMSETFRRKFLSCRGCFLRCEACQKHSAGSFCRVVVASLDARHVRDIPPEVSVMSWLLPWMRGMSETFRRKFLS